MGKKQIFSVVFIPRNNDMEWWEKVSSLCKEYNASLNIKKSSLGNELRKMKTDVYALEYEGRVVPDFMKDMIRELRIY